LFIGVAFGLHKLLFQGIPSPNKKNGPIRNELKIGETVRSSP
jgi:hypothetical protein